MTKQNKRTKTRKPRSSSNSKGNVVAKKKRSSSRKSVRSVSVTTPTKPQLSQIERDVKKLMLASQNKSIRKDTKQVLMQTILPYAVVPKSVKPDSMSVPCAVAKHTKVYTMNFSDLFTAGTPWTNPTNNNRSIWPDFTVGVPVIHVMDPYLLGIVPYRAEDPTKSNYYWCRKFANSNMEGGYKITVPQTAGSVALGNISQDIYWLEPVTFDVTTAGGLSNNESYGKTHAVVDTAQHRLVWVDCNPVNVATVGLSFTVSNITSFITPDYSFRLIAKYCDCQGNFDDSYEYHAYPTLTGTTAVCQLAITNSGYYSFGLVGSYNITSLAVPVTITVDFLRIETTVNIVSRHIINDNVFTSSVGNQFFNNALPLASSLLLSNTTPVIEKGGYVFAVSDSARVPWFGYTQSYQSYILGAPAGSSWKNTWETGAYGWVSQRLTPKYRGLIAANVENTGQPAAIRSYSVMMDPMMENAMNVGMNVYFIQLPRTSIAATDRGTAELVFTTSFQYTSSNQTPSLTLDYITPEEYEEAREILDAFPNFSENKIHAEAFYAAINNATQKIFSFMRMARPVVRPLSVLIGTFPSPVAQGLARALSGLDHVAGEG